MASENLVYEYGFTKKGRFYIETPQGVLKQVKRKDGTISVRLSWNKNFVPNYNSKFLKTQMYIDEKVLKFSEPYIPLQTGMLIKSGILGTIVGTGEVQYLAPYSSDVYYRNSGVGRANGALRGPKWFERMKNDKKDTILKGAKRVMKKEGGF